ncbi:MAG: glycosyltransferase family 4 protein [Fibrobacter sp.]|nr:glycosyltransferase family 4 protein [Fibrobacter sp.]
MKICIIGSVYPRFQDDTEVPWLRRTVNELVACGHDVTVFVPSFRGLKSHTIDGVRVKRFRYFFSKWEDLTGEEGGVNKIHKFHYKLLTILYIVAGSTGLALLNRKEKYDILHVNWPFPHGIFSTFALLFRKTKVILNFHGAELLLAKRFGFVKLFLKYFIVHADAIIVNSSFTGKNVRSIYNKPVTIIPYGTTIEPSSQQEKKKSGRHVFSLGRMIERKGFKYLVEAMSIVVREFPDAKLTIAGGGPQRDQLIEQVKTLGLENSVFLPGKVPSATLNELFTNADMFVLPAIVDKNGDTEGLGVVLVEAMTYKLPVIASNVGGIPDVIIPKVSGVLVEEKNAQSLADAIVDFMRNPDSMKQVGDMGFSFISKEFTWNKVIDDMDRLYRKVVNN